MYVRTEKRSAINSCRMWRNSLDLPRSAIKDVGRSGGDRLRPTLHRKLTSRRAATGRFRNNPKAIYTSRPGSCIRRGLRAVGGRAARRAQPTPSERGRTSIGDSSLVKRSLSHLQHAAGNLSSTLGPGRRDQNEPINAVENKPLRRLALQYIELMTEDENFGVQRSLGSQQPSRKTPHQSKEIAHRTECQPIRRRPSATLGLR